MNYIFVLMFSLLYALTSENSWAESAKNNEVVKQVIQKSLQQVRPDFSVVRVEKTGISNFYEVYLADGSFIYATSDGMYVIDLGREGKVLQVSGGQFVDVRDEKMKPLRVKLLAAVPNDQMIIFSPEGETKAYVSVFTDVDCGYCQKLHAHIQELNALGIEVRYLAFPRAGPNSISAKKLSWAWCAEDKKDALTKLKARQKIPEVSCDSPVAAQYELGNKIGVSGTPAVYTKDGSAIGGYMEPAQMAQLLGLH